MKRFKLFIVLFIVIFSFVAGRAVTLDEIGTEILEEIFRFHPVGATYLGVHTYDTLLADYSEITLNKKLARFQELRKVLDELDTTFLSIDQIIDYHLLKINLNYEMFNIEMIKSYDKDPLIYVRECNDGVYVILVRSSPSTSAKVDAIRKRLNCIPAVLENAKKNLKDPPEILCEIAIDQLMETENLIENIFSVYRDSVPKEQKNNFKQVKEKALEAINLFAYWLKKNSDANSSYILGKENYEYKLKHIHLLDTNSGSLLKLGKDILKSTVKMIDSLEGLSGEPKVKKIKLPSDFGRNHVIAYQKEEIKAVRDFVSKSNLVTVPNWIGELKVVETPGYLRTIIPGIAMQPPGPFDDSNTSYFYVRPLPEKFNPDQSQYYYNYIENHWFKGSVVHEGYPGHHLQLSIANNHPSVVRKSFFDYFFAEGWALYCEELMAHSNLYEGSLAAVIRVEEGVAFRAVRVIVDVMLQTQQFSYEDAVNFMCSTLGGDLTFYEKEVKRYITDPGQASSYLVGKLQILDILDDYKKVTGDKFDLKDFHDRLLKHGTIPLALVRRRIMAEVD